MCQVGTVDKISDYQPEGPTPSVDRDVNLVVSGTITGVVLKTTSLSVSSCHVPPSLNKVDYHHHYYYIIYIANSYSYI